MALNSGSISNVLNTLKAAFKVPQQPVTPLPPPLIVSGGNLRPGLSSRDIASKIIERQSEAGAPNGPAIYQSTNNVSEAMERVRVEEIVNAILTQSKVDVALPPGIPVSTVGVGNIGGPVTSQGATTQIATGNGIIR